MLPSGGEPALPVSEAFGPEAVFVMPGTAGKAAGAVVTGAAPGTARTVMTRAAMMGRASAGTVMTGPSVAVRTVVSGTSSGAAVAFRCHGLKMVAQLVAQGAELNELFFGEAFCQLCIVCCDLFFDHCDRGFSFFAEEDLCCSLVLFIFDSYHELVLFHPAEQLGH